MPLTLATFFLNRAEYVWLHLFILFDEVGYLHPKSLGEFFERGKSGTIIGIVVHSLECVGIHVGSPGKFAPAESLLLSYFFHS